MVRGGGGTSSDTFPPFAPPQPPSITGTGRSDTTVQLLNYFLLVLQPRRQLAHWFLVLLTLNALPKDAPGLLLLSLALIRLYVGQVYRDVLTSWPKMACV